MTETQMISHAQSRAEMLDIALEVKTGEAPGTFEGYGAIFGNLDRDGDIVQKGAFAESLKARLPALLWQHNTKEPIGRFDEVREDAKGLFVRGRLSGQGRGAEAYELLQMGALDGLSIGFVTKEAQRNATTGTRTIVRADLMEVSLVTFPANELARISAVKSAGSIADTRTFERFLRENGFSRSRAKAITAKGFKGTEMMHASNEQGIAAMIGELKSKSDLLHLITKGRPPVGNFQLAAVLSRWSPWKTIGVHGTTEDDYELTADFSLISNAETTFEAELEYVGKSGRKVAKINGPGAIKVTIPGNGWQEPKIRVGAHGTSGVTVRCIVTIHSR